MIDWKRKFAIVLLAGSVALGGCSSDDGKDGAPGAAGTPGGSVVDVTEQTATTLAAMTFTGEITGVTINSPPVVNFKISDSNGRGVVGLTTSNLRFIIAKLVPGTGVTPDTWQSYINTTEEPATKLSGGKSNNVGPDGTPALAKATQATTESNGTLVDNGDGTYTYTFATDVKTTTDPVTGALIGYDPNLTHRLAIQLSGNSLPVANIVYDFVPAGGSVTTKREIAATASCNECHDKLAIHGGGRIEVKYCVTCHNPGTVDANSGNSLDMAEMVHKIHRGHSLPSVEGGGEYAIWGYRAEKHDYSEVGYPQEIKHCRKCHTADSATTSKNTAQGDNWNKKPSIQACGSCHDDVDFSAAHEGAVRTNADCKGCHSASAIETAHLTENATANNPNVPTGAVNFTYEISSVTVNSGTQPVVKFRILGNGTPVVFTGSGSTASSAPAGAVLSGFSGSPSFLIAYASPQDGISAPKDYNNLGKSAAQPASVSIAYLLKAGNTRGTITGPDSDGYYTATITDATYGFPGGSTLRAVALQGYFTQVDPAVARHAISVVKAVTGEARREVVDSAKCANCHEWFEGHGGNRVYNVQVCVMCHVPNLSTSGRGADGALIVWQSTATADTLYPAQWQNTAGTLKVSQGAIDAAVELIAAKGSDPTVYPEATNNMKDMIHGIHASAKRTTPFQFVRDRGTSGVFYYDWSHVTYPGIISNCMACHKDDASYDAELPTGVLKTTNVTALVDGSDVDAIATVAEGRASLPNTTDVVISATAASCVFCHDSTLAQAHMDQNGASRLVQRSVATGTETCVVCHGAGKSADVKVVHGIK